LAKRCSKDPCRPGGEGSSSHERRIHVGRWALIFSLTACFLGSVAVPVCARPGDPPTSEEIGPGAVSVPATTVIRLRGGRLTVKVRNAPWRTVLNELERQTGIEVAVKGLFEGELTDEFETSSLEAGLRRLFRGVDVILFYADNVRGEESKAVMRAWLFPKGVASGRHSPARAAPAAPAEDLIGSPEALERALVDSDVESQTRALQLLTEREGPRVVDRLLKMTSSKEPMTRLQALTLLSQSPADETTVLSALRAALADGHEVVKEYAIGALANQGGSQAMVYLQQALRDPDPKVRLMILENVGQHALAHPLLREALSDSDDAVRELAGFLLGAQRATTE
jgi:HEAT repeats